MYILNQQWLFSVEWRYEKISTAYRRGVIAGAYRRALVVSMIKDSSLLYLLLLVVGSYLKRLEK